MTTPPTDDLAPLAAELAEALAPGIQLGGLLGRGGMGAVFLGRDPALKRPVVVKVLAPDLAHDETARRRFAREAESAAAVAHPHVVAIHAIGELPRSKTAYFVMQHVDGVTLGDACPEGVKVPAARVTRIVGEVASALAAAHARGLVHRDIKPANIMLEKDTERAIVLDFGISAALFPRTTHHAPDTRLTQQGASIGTPQYMSPEQAAGEPVTGQSDVYSLGVVAYELLAGRPPFEATNPMALAAAHIKDTPPDLLAVRPDLDPMLASLVARMLSKAPAERPTAAELSRTLLPATHAVIEWPPPGLERLRGELVSAQRWLVVTMGALLLFFVVLALQPMLETLAYVLLAAVTGFGAVVLFLAGSLGINLALQRIGWARTSGYPWLVGLDVSLDHAPDTGELLNGAGRYAALEPGGGGRLLARRRVAALLLIGGVLATSLLVFLWGTGLADLSFGALVPLTVRAMLVILAPAALGAAGWVALTARERRLRRRTRPREERPFAWLRHRKAAVPEELVRGWLGSAALAAPPARSRWQLQALRNLLEAPAAVGALLVEIAVLATVMGAIFVPRAPVARRDVVARREWVQAVEQAAEGAGSFAALDGMLGAAALAPRAAPPDTAAAHLLVSPGASVVADPAVIWAAFAALPGRLPDSLRLKLEAMAADDPRARAFTRLAQSGPLPALWWAGGTLPAPGAAVPIGRVTGAFAREGLRRAAVAALATARGDRAGAARAGREIVAVGRHLLRDPTPSASAFGLGMVQTGARVLRGAGLALGDGALGRLADSLALRAEERSRQRARFGGYRGSRYFASPADTLVLRLAAWPALAPSDRWAVIQLFGWGVCYDPVEVRRGVSPERRRLIAEAGARAADIPGSATWAAQVQGELDGFERGVFADRGLMRFLTPALRASACGGAAG